MKIAFWAISFVINSAFAWFGGEHNTFSAGMALVLLMDSITER